MDPSDRLEEDFKFYLFFFENNLNELQNEKEKALCQEWLERLEGMRGTRKQRRDRNVYLSQLALAMAEGQLYPPFNAPPPREPLPMPASLFEMFRTPVTQYEKLQESQSVTSSASRRVDTSGKSSLNVASGNIKGNWMKDSLQAPENIVRGKIQTSQSGLSSLSARGDTSEKHLPNEDINRPQVSERIVFQKIQKKQSVTSSSSERAGTSGILRKGGNISRPISPENSVYEKPQIIQSQISSTSAKSDMSGEHRQNGSISRWQTPEKTVYVKPKSNQSMISSLSARVDTSENPRSIGNVNGMQAPDAIVYKKSETIQSEMSSTSTRGDINRKQRPHVAFTKEKSKLNINRPQAEGQNVTQNSQMALSEMSSLSSLSDKSVEKWLATNYKEDESKLNLFSPYEIVPRNQQMLIFKIPFFYTSSETSTEPLSETVNDEEKKKLSNDKSFASNEFDSKKSQTMKSGGAPCISSSDFSHKELPKVSNSTEKSKPSNEILLPVREMELHSRNLSDSQTNGPNFRINPVKNIQLQLPELLPKKHSDSWTKMIPSYRFQSRKKLDFRQPERQPDNVSYYRTCILSNDKLNSAKDRDYQQSGVQSTNFFDSRINVLSKPKFHPDADLSLHRPVVSRTCPQPSQMPLVEESQSIDDEFVRSQWDKIVPQEKAVPHADSLDSLISYSKGQWLDLSCDSESFRSSVSFQSVMSEYPTKIRSHYNAPSVDSNPLQEISLSEKEIQSISLQSLPLDSRKSTPALSLTSVISKSKQEYSPTSTDQSVQDKYTQTQSQQPSPQQENFQKKPVYIPVYIVSADQQQLQLYTPLTRSQIHGRQPIIPSASQLKSGPTSQQIPRGILRKTTNQYSKR